VLDPKPVASFGVVSDDPINDTDIVRCVLIFTASKYNIVTVTIVLPVDNGTSCRQGRSPKMVLCERTSARYFERCQHRSVKNMIGRSPTPKRKTHVPPDPKPPELLPKSPPPVEVLLLLPKPVFGV